MILLLAVAAGSIFGLARFRIKRADYPLPDLNFSWLVVLAVIPQLLAFHIQATAIRIPDPAASLILITSQVCLLLFCWANRERSGFWALGLGLLLNLIVISINGGWMPISLETIQALYPAFPVESLPLGGRPGYSKNILLLAGEIKLEPLADRLLLPDWVLWRRAVSLGDVVIAWGCFWLLGDPDQTLIHRMFPFWIKFKNRLLPSKEEG